MNLKFWQKKQTNKSFFSDDDDEDYSYAGEFDKAEDTLSRLSRLSGEDTPTDQALTRKEQRLSGKGKYPIDPITRKLTPEGKTRRLKHRLNLTIMVLIVLILLAYAILFFL